MPSRITANHLTVTMLALMATTTALAIESPIKKPAAETKTEKIPETPPPAATSTPTPPQSQPPAQTADQAPPVPTAEKPDTTVKQPPGKSPADAKTADDTAAKDDATKDADARDADAQAKAPKRFIPSTRGKADNSASFPVDI